MMMKRDVPTVCTSWTTKKCTTPGCTQNQYHLGMCHTVSSKRQRVAPMTTDDKMVRSVKRGLYDDNLTKGSHREFLYGCLCKGEGPALYLEGEEAGCTRYLIDKGIDPARLCPCNYNLQTARYIESTTGVKCVHGDIIDVACSSAPGAYAVVWYDMTGTDVPLSKVAHASTYVMITVNARAESVDMKERQIVTLCKSITGAKILQSGKYRGTGNKFNMTFVFFKNPMHSSSSESDSDVVGTEEAESEQMRSLSSDVKDWMGVPLRVPLTRWTDVGLTFDTTLYKIVDGCVLATVVDFDKKKLILKYQTAGGKMMADQRKFEDKMHPVTTDLARQWLY